MAMRRFKRFKKSYKPRYSKRRYRGRLAPRRTGGFFGVRRNSLAAEKKFNDTFNTLVTASGMSNTGSFFLLNGIGAGTGFNERVGRKIKIKTIQLNITVLVGSVVPARCRLMVVIDRQANGVAPTLGNILDTTLISSPSKAFMNLDNRARFSVIWDKKFTLDTTTYTLRDFNVFKKKLIDVTYNGITNGIGSIATNSLYLVAMSDAAAANAPALVCGSRIRYTDV